MTFTLTTEQRAACDAFEKTCRELCVGRMKSIDAGFISSGRGQIVGGVQDGIKVYWPDGYGMGLADRLEQSIQKMRDAHGEVSVETQKTRRLAELEAEAERLRAELTECVA